MQRRYQKLVDDSPAVTEFRSRLADSQIILGIRLSSTDKPSEAEAEYRKAIALYQTLADGNPKSLGYSNRLANCLCKLGDALRSLGRPAEAKGGYECAIAHIERVVKEGPTEMYSRLILAASLLGRGLARRDLGDPAGTAAGTDAQARARTAPQAEEVDATEHKVEPDTNRRGARVRCATVLSTIHLVLAGFTIEVLGHREA